MGHFSWPVSSCVLRTETAGEGTPMSLLRGTQLIWRLGMLLVVIRCLFTACVLFLAFKRLVVVKLFVVMLWCWCIVDAVKKLVIEGSNFCDS